MDTTKMRDQFEAWALSAKAHGEHFDLSRGNHGAYKSPITHWLYCSWVASYQASREAVVIELPDRFGMDGFCAGLSPDEDGPVVYVEDLVRQIEALGLKVAP